MTQARNEIESLRVIELKIKKEATHFRPSSRRLLNKTQAFRPESCVRQVYIYLQQFVREGLDKVLEDVRENTDSIKIYAGEEAYAFLLSWVVGGEYRELKPKSPLPLFNDNHIMGRFKQEWQKVGGTTKQRFDKVIQLLMKDAHQIRLFVEGGQYGKDYVLRKNLDLAISNIIFSHRHGFPVAYPAMHEERIIYLDSLNQFLTKTIHQMQDKISSKQEKIKKITCDKMIFNNMMKSIYQKRLLQHLIQVSRPLSETTLKLT